MNALIKLENEPINVDVQVHLPDGIMQEKDHWDQRYFRKRAIYLAYIASQLNKLKKYKMEFAIDKHRIKPSLTLEKDGVKFCLQISCDQFCKVIFDEIIENSNGQHTLKLKPKIHWIFHSYIVGWKSF